MKVMYGLMMERNLTVNYIFQTVVIMLTLIEDIVIVILDILGILLMNIVFLTVEHKIWSKQMTIYVVVKKDLLYNIMIFIPTVK